MTIFQKVSIISFGDRAVGNTIKLRQSPGPGPGPAPRDTSLFRERGRTAGVCRVESATRTRQRKTKVHFAPTSFYAGEKRRHLPAPLLLLSNCDPLRWARSWWPPCGRYFSPSENIDINSPLQTTIIRTTFSK